MSDIDRFRPEDRRGIDTLQRRTLGADAAEATRLRWDWLHGRNPFNPSGRPGIWVAREGPTVVGHCVTQPVRVSLKGLEVEGAWGGDAMVAPERERTGLGEALIRTWDRNSGAALTVGLSQDTRDLLDRMHWPESTTVPCLVKPLTRRAVRVPSLPDVRQPGALGVDLSARAGGGAVAAAPSRVSSRSGDSTHRSPRCGSVWRPSSIWPSAGTRRT